MSNLISLERLPDRTLSMSNGLTSSFINIFGLSGTALAQTDHEKMLVIYVLEQNQSVFGIGCVGFDIGWMPWDAHNLEKDRQFILAVIDGMSRKQGWEFLEYTPNEEWLAICIGQFKDLILNLNPADIDAGKAQEWLESRQGDDPPLKGFPLCPFHRVFMTAHGCQLCTD